jgi:CheY-like chemotaxis protein
MADLAGVRVLIVEDEGVVALMIEDMLLELGCEISASAANMAAAQKLAMSGAFDVAVLDVNLAGEPIFTVAEQLQNRGIPFVFSTGYGRAGVPEAFKHCQILSKPFAMEDLRLKISVALGW